MTADPLALLAALADDARLRVFAHILLADTAADPMTTARVAADRGLGEKDALKLLTRLESVGLLAREDGGWVARPDVLRIAVAGAGPDRSSIDHGASDPDVAAVLRVYLPHGRLEQMPTARAKRLVVLDHIARIFEPGVRYPEKDVNVLLTAFHSDYALVRRCLVDEGFLARDAGTYWRSGGGVDL